MDPQTQVLEECVEHARFNEHIRRALSFVAHPSFKLNVYKKEAVIINVGEDIKLKVDNYTVIQNKQWPDFKVEFSIDCSFKCQ